MMNAVSRAVGAAALCIGTLSIAGSAGAQSQVIPVYSGTAPGTEGWPQKESSFDLQNPQFNPPSPDTLVLNVTRPTLTVFRPAAGKANGTAIVVAPGGGFRVLSYKNEGVRVAQWLADRGVTAFVLKYRLNPMPSDPAEIMKGMEQMAKMVASRPAGSGAPAIAMGPVENGAIVDGQQAIKLVRSRAGEFGVDPHKIGIIGFSAGGAVAGGAAVKADPADRPDFVGIIYSFTPGTIPQGAPPAFLAAAADDPLSGGMPDLFNRWRASGASAELHIYAKGQHGFATVKQNLPVDGWLDSFGAWMGQQGFLAPASR
jgi:acetyl esterase/lipase